MKSGQVLAAAALLLSSVVHAVPRTWELLDGQLNVIGTFVLDLDAQAVTNASINGNIGNYTIPSSFTLINTNSFVGPYPVENYFKIFSIEAGKVYTQDLGGGEYHQIRVNDSAIDIGALGVLVPDGTLYEAFIQEIYNFDEISVVCAYFEEIYDDEGNIIGQGPCLFYDTFASYNNESGDWYEGYYLRSYVHSPSTYSTVGLPLPVAAWLLPILLAGMGAWRLRKWGQSPFSNIAKS